jgi:hypothetical protein
MKIKTEGILAKDSKQRDDLKEMILDYVSQAAGRLVECATHSHAEAFRQGDLDAGDVVAVPDWFKE